MKAFGLKSTARDIFNHRADKSLVTPPQSAKQWALGSFLGFNSSCLLIGLSKSQEVGSGKWLGKSGHLAVEMWSIGAARPVLQTLGRRKREQHSSVGCKSEWGQVKPATLARHFTEVSVWVTVLTFSRKVRGSSSSSQRGCVFFLTVKIALPFNSCHIAINPLSCGGTSITKTGKAWQEQAVCSRKDKFSLWTGETHDEVLCFLQLGPNTGPSLLSRVRRDKPMQDRHRDLSAVRMCCSLGKCCCSRWINSDSKL